MTNKNNNLAIIYLVLMTAICALFLIENQTLNERIEELETHVCAEVAGEKP